MHAVINHLGDPILTARALTTCFPKGTASGDKKRLIEIEGRTEKESNDIMIKRVLEQAEILRKEDHAETVAS
jgi:hypothetical protein